MKIVHVVYSMEMGGAEMLVAQLSRLQRNKGHDVRVCAYSKLGKLGEWLRSEGIPVYVTGEAHPAIAMLRWFRLFRSIRPDVVHCHNAAPTLQAALPARVSGAACIVATRHSLVEPPFDKAAELKFNLVTLAADWIVGICDITCSNLRQAPLAHRTRITRVYNGAAAIDATPGPLRDEAQSTLLFIGRLAKVKDLRTLLHAFALASAKIANLRLWIVGDGPERVSLEALTRDLGVTAHVFFWGEQEATAQFYSAADIFVMSSTSEGLPMSLLQSMSMGLPSVVTDVGGMSEVSVLSGGGLRTPVGDSEAMASAIESLATDETLRIALGKKAKLAYSRGFTLEHMEAAYATLYGSTKRRRRL